MSIDRLNHLRFPANPGPAARAAERSIAPEDTRVPGAESTESNLTTGADASELQSSNAKAAVPRLTVRIPTLSERIEPAQVSVVVTIQSDNQIQDVAPEPVVYGDARKLQAPVDDEAHLAQMQVAHQRAQERSASVVTALKVDADGIVVARQPDFVSVAVSAMREFKDEAERQKRYALPTSATNSSESAAATTPLRGFQHLASRFNLFA